MFVDSFDERSGSCDGSPQPLAEESIVKTSARLELIICTLVPATQCRLIRSYRVQLTGHKLSRGTVQAGAGGRRLERDGRRLGGRRLAGDGRVVEVHVLTVHGCRGVLPKAATTFPP